MPAAKAAWQQLINKANIRASFEAMRNPGDGAECHRNNINNGIRRRWSVALNPFPNSKSGKRGGITIFEYRRDRRQNKHS
jgi:hypothetical protein